MSAILFFDDEPYTSLDPLLEGLLQNGVVTRVATTLATFGKYLQEQPNISLVVLDLHHRHGSDDCEVVGAALDLVSTYRNGVRLAVYSNFTREELPKVFRRLQEVNVEVVLNKGDSIRTVATELLSLASNCSMSSEQEARREESER